MEISKLAKLGIDTILFGTVFDLINSGASFYG